MSKAATNRAGWRTVAFGDVVRLSTERSSTPESDGFARFVGLEHIEPGDLRIRRWGDITDGTTFTNVFRQGQVLFGKRRAYQRKVAVADFNGVCSGDIYVLEPKGKDLLPELLPFICQTDAFFEHAVGTSAGSLSPRTNWISLAGFEFALPAIAEQRRLVHVLQACEDATEKYLALEGAARTMWLARVESIEVEHASATRHLGDLLQAVEPGRSVVGVDSLPLGGEYAVLKVSAVDPLGFQPNESKRLVDQSDFMPEHVVRAGDLLMTRSNTPALVGETCLVDQDYPNLMLCDKTLRLVPIPGLPKTLLWHMLQSNRVRQQIAAVATGTGGAMKNISQPKIRALDVCYPSSSDRASQVERELVDCFAAFRAAMSRRKELGEFRTALVNSCIRERDV